MTIFTSWYPREGEPTALTLQVVEVLGDTIHVVVCGGQCTTDPDMSPCRTENTTVRPEDKSAGPMSTEHTHAATHPGRKEVQRYAMIVASLPGTQTVRFRIKSPS